MWLTKWKLTVASLLFECCGHGLLLQLFFMFSIHLNLIDINYRTTCYFPFSISCFKQKLILNYMKKSLLLFVLLSALTNTCFSQTYIAIAPALTNDAGTIPEKANLSFEIGRQWNVFSMGLDIGKTSLGKVKGRDTTAYLEIRPNLNVFQQGKFTNTLTVGIGYIFNSNQSLMTEITSGIEYSYSSKMHFNAYFGQYYYSGRVDASTVTFFGVSGMLYFLPSHAKPLIRKASGQAEGKPSLN